MSFWTTEDGKLETFDTNVIGSESCTVTYEYRINGHFRLKMDNTNCLTLFVKAAKDLDNNGTVDEYEKEFNLCLDQHQLRPLISWLIKTYKKIN